MTKEEKDKVYDALFKIEDRHPNFTESVIDNSYCNAINEVKYIIEAIPTTESVDTTETIEEEVRRLIDVETDAVGLPGYRGPEYHCGYLDALETVLTYMQNRKDS